LAPADGLVAGGTTVTITGTGLTDATAVNFGGTSASSFIVDSDTTITAVAPATALELGKSCRTVGVSVATAGGTSTDTSADDYLYYTLTVTSGSTTQTYSLSDIKARASVSGYWGPHRDYGVNNYYTGTPLLALLADVGGLPIGKGLRITSSDGFVADYDAARLAAMTSGTYQMWYPATSPLMVDDIETAGSVEMIAAYQMDGSPLTLDQAAEGAGPIRVVLIRSIADVLTEGKYAPYIVKSIVVR
jgi:hypothetical protein